VVIEIVIDPAALLIVFLVVIAIVVVAAWKSEESTRRRRVEYRARIAEQEIQEIGQGARQAILAEARRRVINGPRG
jgi:hypothetical protein